MRRRDRPSPHPRRTSVSLGAPVTISDLQRLATAKASSVGSNGWLPFVRQQSASATLSLLRTVVLALHVNPAPAIVQLTDLSRVFYLFLADCTVKGWKQVRHIPAKMSVSYLHHVKEH